MSGELIDKTPALLKEPINDRPSFVVGPSISTTDESGQQRIEWATMIVAGPADEAQQSLQFVVASNTVADLFAEAPTITADGTLRFTPRPNASGKATITVQLVDGGGTALGGIDKSLAQTFTIEIVKPRPMLNVAMGNDASGDGHVTPADALAIINYLNAYGPGPVSEAAANTGLDRKYLDANGDNLISPGDALKVINYLNAFTKVAPEPAGEAVASEVPDDLLTLLSAEQSLRPRRKHGVLAVGPV